MKRIKIIALILITLLVLICLSFWIYSVIISRSIDKITLVEVSHPYIGEKVDSILLDKSKYSDFIRDYKIKYPQLFLKFYSCYVIKIYYKNGEFESFRTNGHAIEMLCSSRDSRFKTFKFSNSKNIITKYWDKLESDQCNEYLGKYSAKKKIRDILSDTLQNYSLVDTLIKDKSTAIRIAELYLFNIYGKRMIKEERPYNIYLIDGYWIITGTLPARYKLGGTFEIIINSMNGQVMRLSHGK